ncbi:T9SS type A sorting domain-containing protein [Flavobacterium buctense]|uniref:T9SS type A sorting domain-containing protein n=1 Tax=Flavobacterium buctense TaxID=1648146 RepID=A0ABU9E1D4_9FLAO|nr:T9SS type A sorting domain-containing protein [Flavobacterium buctense]
MKATLLFLALFFLPIVGLAQAGTLDTTFDSDGKKYFGFSSQNDYGEFVLIQPDNKIIAGGNSSLTGGNLSFSLARMHPDGSFDDTFGTSGKVTTTYGTEGFEAVSGALQSDGKIIVIGTSFINSSLGTAQVAVVRYNTDGTLDTSFDADGIVLTQISTSNEDFGKTVKIQPDGKILLAVQSRIDFNRDFVLVRYNSDGSLDTTFDSDGIARTNLPTQEAIYDIALQNDGKIIATGYIANTNDDLRVARYNGNGSLDTTFGTNGFFTYDFASNHNYGASVAVTSDNKIIIGGRYQNTSFFSPFVAKLNSNGTFDASFDSDGILILTTDESISDVAIQSDDKIITFGTSNSKFGVWKLNSNGTFDTTFGNNGKAEILVNTILSFGNGGTLQADGKIVMIGLTFESQFMKYGVVRLNNNAPLANSSFAAADLMIYPNPSNGTFFIQNAAELSRAEVTIYNLIGQEVTNFKMISATQEVTLQKGVYVVEMVNERSKVSKKIVVN